MTEIIPEKVCGYIDGDFVALLFGMRINKLWKLHKWLPIIIAMDRMLEELTAQPVSGFLGSISSRFLIVHWRSFKHLEAYARSTDYKHWPAWINFNRRMARSQADVGIWHETYSISAGQYEAIYRSMPRFGLGQAGNISPATKRKATTCGRIDVEK